MGVNVTKEEIYEVEYHYYRCNSGAADNGYYTKTKKCASAEEAVTLAARINEAAKDRIVGDEVDALKDDLIGYAGTFEWARPYHLVVERTLLQ